ncbi:putative cysteine synthase B [Venustampulla echinocandica]|uniref:Putative cysteine synthase B n=1 Tax=Venustampulla echinocandica TaxID=2656787 RepID=A0A370TIM9_9HELO|nr:putative cysteine synthase B [Venustampulla echinocandica]RDL35205.1 putative cysteine synthase B [Venustampulla echinocandica]
MSVHNPLNIYSGKDSLQKYFDPDFAPLLPLVEIPDEFNPFREDGVRIYAKMMTMLPANNVKALPALDLLAQCVKPEKTKTVVEYSSGSTIISMSMIARVVHGISDCRAYLSNKTGDTKLKLMQFFGLDITLFPGPSQPEPYDSRGGIQVARRMALEDETVCNPNQYEHDANWGAHYKWTGPQILKQLPDLSVMCAGVGTSGTMTGIGTYLGEKRPSVVRVGVFTAVGDRVPGPRPYSLMEPVKFPWRAAIDAMEEVGSTDSFGISMKLSRAGIICGPSSGFNLKGLCQFLSKRKEAGTLRDLASPNGDINCVFICCDLPYQYLNDYFDKLDSTWFPQIHNRHLTEVDLYNNYEEVGEREPSAVIPDFYELSPATADPLTLALPLSLRNGHAVLDLRTEAEFAVSHLPQATNIPLDSLTPGSPSPFSDSDLFAAQWREMEALFGGGSLDTASDLAKDLSKKKRVLIVCHGGDTARVASTILRSKGANAECMKGGMEAVGRGFCVLVKEQKGALCNGKSAAMGVKEIIQPEETMV